MNEQPDPITYSLQTAVINAATQKFGRDLTEHEKCFITSRGGYIPIGAIMDTVQAEAGGELERYLNSEP